MKQEMRAELGRIVRFGITGSLSVLIHYGVYLLALQWMSATLAYTVGYGVGLMVNYVMTAFFTFKKQPSRKNAVGFVFNHVVNYLMEIGLLNLMIHLGVKAQIAGILTLMLVVPVSFMILRFVFVGRKNGAAGNILLSFDTEEFDVPREHGVDFSLEQGMQVSREGTNRILDVLRQNDVKATFFCTGNFARLAPDMIRRIMEEGHEVACHGVDHWHPKEGDVAESKKIVERIAGRTVYGYRQPRMFSVSDEDIRKAGYRYNSSLNPAFIPGRYMHLTAPRTPFMKEGVLQIPASVTPWIRFPLFWLSLHNLPEWLYHLLVRCTLGHDGQFVTYFHPWEFYDLKEHPEFRMPFIIRNHSGRQMMQRLDRLVKMLKERGHHFITYTEFSAYSQKI